MNAKPLVLVTGATGFAGSHAADLLIDRGYPVRVLVRRTSRLRWVRPEAEQVVADVRDRESLRSAVRGARWVFHFGGLIRARNRDEFFEANAGGTRNLYDVFREDGHPELFLFCSTLAAVGPGGPGQSLKETDPAHPVTDYGASKRAAEQALLEETVREGAPRVLILRPPAVYGPRDESIVTFVRVLKTGWVPLPAPPEARVAVIHAEDLAAGALHLAERGGDGIFHLSDGEGYAWRDLARILAEAMGLRPRYIRIPLWVSRAAALLTEAAGRWSGRPALLTRGKLTELIQMSWVPDIGKAEGAGYRPMWDAQGGLRMTLDWYRESGWI